MKQVEIRIQSDRQWLTEPFTTFFHSENIDEAVLFAYVYRPNASEGLFRIVGDSGFEADLSASPLIESINVDQIDDKTFIAKLGLAYEGAFDSLNNPLMDHDVVLVLPIIFREEQFRYRLIGPQDAISSMLSDFPDEIPHEILRLTSVTGNIIGAIDLLTAKQRRAVETAMRLGYYERPRQVTHAEIASELDCSPSNVSIHLQVAESKLISELFSLWADTTGGF